MKSIKEITEESSGETREVLEKLVRRFAETIQENRQLKQKIDLLSQDIRLLKKRLFGTSSEKMPSSDTASEPELFDEFELCRETLETDTSGAETSDEGASKAKASSSKPSKQRGRKPLPAHLNRRIVTHDLPEADKQCHCGCQMACIGETTSEELEYKRAELLVVEHHCKKYACSNCSQENQKDPSVSAQLKTAKKPAQLIPKSIATPSLISQIIIQKFCDHLPLYRQEQVFQRYDIDLSRQVMSSWVIKASEAVIPLINLLQEKILDYDVAFADETTLQVLEEAGRRAQTKSYMWCFLGGPVDQRIIIYEYHPSRSGSIPEAFFENYKGALHCDGYSGYTKLIESPWVVGINCMAHVRRKFMEALPGGKEKGVSGQVVRLIRTCYRIESQLKDAKADATTIYHTRQEHAKPILEELKRYLDEKSTQVPPQSKVGQAIHYAIKRWRYLTTYLEDGRYEIDNNRAERAIKPFVIGRKNWLFSQSPSGAHASARLFSLIETAKANQLDPLQYMDHILKELPACQCLEDYEALLPWRAKEKLKQPIHLEEESILSVK